MLILYLSFLNKARFNILFQLLINSVQRFRASAEFFELSIKAYALLFLNSSVSSYLIKPIIDLFLK